MRDFIRGKALVYLVAIFVAGLAAGAAAGFALGKGSWSSPPPRPEDMTERFMGKLRNELALTDQQAAQIRPIIEESGRKFHAIHEEVGQRIGAVFEENDKRMESFLTPEQVRKLSEMRRERESRSRARFGERPTGHKPGSH